MNRNRLVELMLGKLTDKSSNDEVVNHVESILEDITKIHQEVVKISLSSFTADIDSKLSLTVDVSQAITYISKGKYFNALTSVSDFLLAIRSNGDRLNLLETFSVYSVLSGMINTDISINGRLEKCV